jgi:hypothetical protein
MNYMSRMLRGFFVMTTLGLTCISFSASWLFERGALSDSFDACIALLEAQIRNEQLVREVQISTARAQAKGKVAEALKNGEMKLIDAAAYFCMLHEDPKSWHDPRRPRPDPQDIAGWCSEVIEWTEKYTSFVLSPGQVEALHQRLEKDLQEQLEKHGSVQSPKGAAGSGAMPARAARAAAES